MLDPSHDERKALQAGRLPQWLTLEQAKSAALHADPSWSPWTYELLTAALNEIQDRGDNISTTALVGPCPRSTVLERKEGYIGDMDDLWRAFRGTMVHRVLEFSCRPESIAEARFYATVDGEEEISCSPDLVTPDSIWDYKNTKQNPKYDYPYRTHVLQLQFNRYIVNNMTRVEKDGKALTDFPFDPRTTSFQHLVVAYLDIDGPKPLEIKKSVEIPGQKRKRRVPDVWDDKQVLEELLPRYRAMRAAMDSYPVFPAGVEELWGGEPTWACPGFPHCPLKGMCLASRWPKGLTW